MRYRRFNGIEKDWSAITFGCWQIAPSEGWGAICSEEAADGVVNAALDSGITAFDTAEGYGDGESEKRLGKALGAEKDDVIIISKIWPDAKLDMDSYRSRLDGTLHELQRDYVDVYLVHWPGDNFDSSDKSTQLCDLMASLVESGKVTRVGLSNFHKRDLSLLANGLRHFSFNEVPYSLLDRRYDGETRLICEEHDLAYIAYSPTGKGLLAGRVDAEARSYPARSRDPYYLEPRFSESLKVLEVVQEIALECEVQAIAVALSWVLTRPNIWTVITGSRKVEQVSGFAIAGDLELNADQLMRLEAASDAYLEKFPQD